MIDLSAGIKSEFEDSIKKARKYNEKEDSINAAKEYERCSRLMKQLAGCAESEKVRNLRIEKSRKYKKISEKLRSGAVVYASGSEAQVSRKTNKQKSQKEEDFRENASGMIEKSPVTWNDIGGLDKTKNTIKESIVISYAKRPDNVEIEGWNRILLYGPPGTGKTLLAAATSNGLSATFFNVKLGKLKSKYFGESSKIMENLFKTAREKSPSVIFFDEIDSIASARGSEKNDAERAILASLLSELDGLSGKKSDEFILTIASTNTPWDIDNAIISRFEKRIYIPLPDEKTRRIILKIHLEKGFAADVDNNWLISQTKNMSGRDIKNLCKEVVMSMLREQNPGIHDLADRGIDEIKKYPIKVRKLIEKDFRRAFDRVRASANEEMIKKYEEWDEQFGAS